MDDNLKLISALFDNAVEYCKTSYELVKLKALEVVSNVIASILTDIIFYIIVAVFIIFVSMGAAFWLGEITGKIFYGFFIVAAFYGLILIVWHLIIGKSVNKSIGDYVIKKIIKNIS